MNSQKAGRGCLQSLLGLLTVVVFLLALCITAFLISPSVRLFMANLGVPFDRLLPAAYVNKILNDDPESAVTDVRSIEEDGRAFQALTDDQKLIYQQILDGVRSVQETFVVYGAQKEDVEPTYHAVLTDHPELFWVDGSTSFTYFELGSTMTISPGFSIPADQVEDVRTRIEEVADEFISSLPTGVDDYGIAKAAYEFVINTTDYDANASQNQNIQSVFLYHASVCAGYSRAFQYLLQRAGVYCSFVEGEIPSSGEDHAWNLVRMGEDYTYVDVTWGDPTYPGLDEERAVGATYDYLGLTTEEILRDDHAFADESLWPACTSTACSYYAREGFLYDAYDVSALSQGFWRQIGESLNTVSFKFSNEAAYAQARDALFANDFLMDDLRTFFAESGSRDNTYQYQYSDSLFILKLFV